MKDFNTTSICLICQEEDLITLDMENNIMQTQCFHLFHKECMEKWLEYGYNCPCCRFELQEENKPPFEDMLEQIILSGEVPPEYEYMKEYLEELITEYHEALNETENNATVEHAPLETVMISPSKKITTIIKTPPHIPTKTNS